MARNQDYIISVVKYSSNIRRVEVLGEISEMSFLFEVESRSSNMPQTSL